MLDDKDLKKLEKLLDSRIKIQVNPLTKELKSRTDSIEQKLESLSSSLNDLESELKSEISRLELGITTKLLTARQDIKLEMKPLARQLSKISKDTETIVSFFDTEIMSVNQRITRIEEHLTLKPQSRN